MPTGSKIQILDDLHSEFQEWQSLITRLEAEELTHERLVGDWTIKDTLSHLSAWQKISVARLEAAVRGASPLYPDWFPGRDPETPQELERVNEVLRQSRQMQNWGQVSAEWEAQFLEIMTQTKEIPEADLVSPGKYAWLGDSPLMAVLEGTLQHHREHREDWLAKL